MRRTILYLAAALLMACGSGGDSSNGEVTITGRVYNQAVSASLRASQDIKGLYGANPPYSILNAACAGLSNIPMAPVSAGDIITVEWTIENNSGGPLEDIMFNVEVEYIQAMTRETWTCLKWYDNWAGNGSSGHSIWEQEGGYFYNAVAAPSLPACESPMVPIGDTCDPVTYDCANPYWAIDHNAASGGCSKGTGFVSLHDGQSFTGAIGSGHSNMDIRPGHLARFQASWDGRMMDEKCYVFEVTP